MSKLGLGLLLVLAEGTGSSFSRRPSGSFKLSVTFVRLCIVSRSSSVWSERAALVFGFVLSLGFERKSDLVSGSSPVRFFDWGGGFSNPSRQLWKGRLDNSCNIIHATDQRCRQAVLSLHAWLQLGNRKKFNIIGNSRTETVKANSYLPSERFLGSAGGRSRSCRTWDVEVLVWRWEIPSVGPVFFAVRGC